MSLKILKKVDFLLKEVDDPVAQENFWRLKQMIESGQVGSGSGAPGPVGPMGPAGPAGDSFWQKITVTVPASSTLAVDTALLSSFRTGEYAVNFYNGTLLKTKSLKMLINNDDAGISDQVYAKRGDALNVAISAVESGPNFLLNVTNNELSSVDVVLIRSLF